MVLKIEILKVSLQQLKGKAVEEVNLIKIGLKIILQMCNNQAPILLICLVVLLVQILASTSQIFSDKDLNKITLNNRLVNSPNKQDNQHKSHINKLVNNSNKKDNQHKFQNNRQ